MLLHPSCRPWVARLIRAALAACALVLVAVGPAAAREVPITILHTTDLHGHLLPWEQEEGEGTAGGLLRCASVIEGVRARAPNVLYVDCGDLVQGGAESWLTKGRVMVRALEWLKADAWVPGNHDFDWGIDALASLLDSSTLTVLGANITARAGTTNRLARIRPFIVKDVDGVRVALVGLTTPAVPTWLQPESLGNTVFEKSVETLAKTLPLVRRENPDLLVLLVHQGYQALGDDTANEVNTIARRFPEFDVILGGHLHKPLADIRLNGVLYAQAGCHGGFVGRVDLVYDTIAKTVVSRSSELLTVDERVGEAEELAQLLQPEVVKARAYLDEEVGSSETAWGTRRAAGVAPVEGLICAAIAEASGAEVVLHGVLSAAGLEVGPIRRRDLWRLVPYENSIGVVLLTPEELRRVLEENVGLLGSTHALGLYGASYDLDAEAAPGSRVRNLRLADGRKPHPRRRLKVATSSYALASGGGRYPFLRRLAVHPVSRLEMTGVDTRSAVADYVRRHNPLRAPGPARPGK